jgi:hypothetical protein
MPRATAPRTNSAWPARWASTGTTTRARRAGDEGVELSGDARGVGGAVGVGALLARSRRSARSARFASAMASAWSDWYAPSDRTFLAAKHAPGRVAA